MHSGSDSDSGFDSSVRSASAMAESRLVKQHGAAVQQREFLPWPVGPAAQRSSRAAVAARPASEIFHLAASRWFSLAYLFVFSAVRTRLSPLVARHSDQQHSLTLLQPQGFFFG